MSMLRSMAGIGLILLAIAMVAWIMADQGRELPIPQLDKIAGVLGLALVGLHFVIYLTQTVGGLGVVAKKGRCTRCGKKALKGEIYCARHMREVREEFKEAHRRR